jgi:hypothetical protein
MLELAARKQKPLLLASTSEVYGKLDKPKFSEYDDLILGKLIETCSSSAVGRCVVRPIEGGEFAA